MPLVRDSLTSVCLLSGSNGVNMFNSSTAKVSQIRYDHRRFKVTVDVLLEIFAHICLYSLVRNHDTPLIIYNNQRFKNTFDTIKDLLGFR